MESARKIDTNGFVTIQRNPISRSGVFPYLGKSIGAPEPDRVYYVYRPEEELRDPATLESFKLLPLVDDHTMLGANDGMQPAEQKGVHGATTEDVVFENGVLYAGLRIFSETLKGLIGSGKKALSAGYRCTYEKSAGVFNGLAYDYIQRQMRGNHLALVNEARCDVSVLDHHLAFDHFDLALDTGENNMADETNSGEGESEMTLAQAIALLKEILPQIQALNEAVASLKGTEGTAGASATGDTGTAAAGLAKDEDDSEEEKEKKKKEKEKKDAEDTAAEEEKSKKEKKEGMDAADKKISALENRLGAVEKSGVKTFMSEISKRDALVRDLSPVIGTFDASDKTLDEVAAYGVEKLGLKVAKGQEHAALTGFLTGRKASTVGFALDHTQKAGGGKLRQRINGAQA